MWAASTRGSNPFLNKEGKDESTDSFTDWLLDRSFGDGRGSIGVRISPFPGPQSAGGAGNRDQRPATKPASPKRQSSTRPEHRWTRRREERGPTGCEGS